MSKRDLLINLVLHVILEHESFYGENISVIQVPRFRLHIMKNSRIPNNGVHVNQKPIQLLIFDGDSMKFWSEHTGYAIQSGSICFWKKEDNIFFFWFSFQ